MRLHGRHSSGMLPWTDSMAVFIAGSLLCRQTCASVPHGLVREEDVHPLAADAIDPDDAEFLKQLPKGPVDMLLRLAISVFARSWFFAHVQPPSRKCELDCTLPHCKAAAGATTTHGLNEPPQQALEDLLIHIHNSVTLMGFLLLVIVPATILLYSLLNREMHWPPHLRRMGSAIAWLLTPLDFLLTPILIRAASLLRLRRNDVLSEDVRGPEVVRRARRVLLGLVLLNVLSSAIAMCVLLLFVFIVRTESARR
mmetsp:Transcript_45709/g.106094  ORF Transcript_45709/g.106094 Transcript_45709/m.106094 type:complete len:254 (-) Transcript_45709:4-765(-)